MAWRFPSIRQLPKGIHMIIKDELDVPLVAACRRADRQRGCYTDATLAGAVCLQSFSPSALSLCPSTTTA